MQRVTVRVPEALIEAANHVMVVLGKATSLNSYRAAGYQGDVGGTYSLSSGHWTAAQIAGVTQPEVLAGVIATSGLPEGVDPALVMQAQAAFVLVTDMADLIPAHLDPDRIVAVVTDDPHAVLAVWGITPIQGDGHA